MIYTFKTSDSDDRLVVSYDTEQSDVLTVESYQFGALYEQYNLGLEHAEGLANFILSMVDNARV